MQSQPEFDAISKPTIISSDEMSNLHAVQMKRKKQKMRENTEGLIVSTVLDNNHELHSAADWIMKSR
jgi:hypothetical protein